jgi:GNAT superfamily N-acetyltransferase
LQVISLDATEVRDAKAARELLVAYAFGTDAWPERSAEEAADHALAALDPKAAVSALLDGGGWQWMAAWAPLEFDTALFGRALARLHPLVHRRGWPELEALSQGRRLLEETARQAREAGMECLTARVPGRDFLAAQALEQTGFLLQDVSVEWMLSLREPPKADPLPAGLELRPWRRGDENALTELAAKSFCDLDAYADRFAMDPRLRPGCGEMYRRWTANALSGDQADQVLVLTENEEPAGFIALRLPPGGKGPGADCGWVVMNAIAPRLRGGGLYRRLLAAGLKWFERRGVARVRVRTKLSQQAVISSWRRFGGRQVYADLTFNLWLR